MVVDVRVSGCREPSSSGVAAPTDATRTLPPHFEAPTRSAVRTRTRPMGAREGSGDFGGRLRRHREAAGLSQEELAERAALTANAISALERGERQRPYPQTVRALSDALSLSDADRSALIAAVPNRVRPQRSDEAISALQPVALLLPSEPTPLLGRVDELRIIREQLVSPNVR